MEPVVCDSKTGFLGLSVLLVADAEVLRDVCEGGGGGAIRRIGFYGGDQDVREGDVWV